MVRKIVANEIFDSKHLLGTFLDESHYDILIEEDCDVYAPAGCDLSTTIECKPETDCSDCTRGISEDRVAFKFRKNFFSKEQQQAAYEGLISQVSKQHPDRSPRRRVCMRHCTHTTSLRFAQHCCLLPHRQM